LHDYFKIKSVNYNSSARYIGGLPLLDGYNDIYIDEDKTEEEYNHHLKRIESFEPTEDANKIFKYESYFDESTDEGSMKGENIGLEYLGEDYKLVLTSLPLYFMKEDQAQTFVEFVMVEKFLEKVGIDGITDKLRIMNYELEQNYPNPFNPETRINYQLLITNYVNLSVFNNKGEIVKVLVDGKEDIGKYSVSFDGSKLNSGVYYYRLLVGDRSKIKKMILIK
jgi:hypothetical protein